MSAVPRASTNVVSIPTSRDTVVASHDAAHADHDGRVIDIDTPVSFDEWGRHPNAVRLARRVATLRWSVAVGGLDNVSSLGGALIVCNARPFAMSPVLVALELSERLGRTVRFAGVPGMAPLSAIARRTGAILSHPDEVASALRGDDLVVLGATSGRNPLVSSTLRAAAMSFPFAQMAAINAIPVVPAATISSPFSRSARIELGTPITAPGRRSPVLDGAQLAEAMQVALQALLDRSTPSAMTTITSRGLF